MADPHRPHLRSAGPDVPLRLGTSSRKTTGPAIAAHEVGPLDAVLLTHEHHADNLDDTGRLLLPPAGSW